MRVATAKKYLMELSKYSETDMYLMIYDVYKKHMNNEKLSGFETFVIGLRYSEFLATDYSDTAYCVAEALRQELLRKLNITVKDFNARLYSLTGLN